MKKLETLQLSELKAVLKWLKLYSDITRKIGKRWKALFHRTLSWTNSYKVEYTSSMKKETAWKQAQKAFQKSFGETPSEKEVTFVENDTIFGWIKIFQNDDMLDLSLSKAMNQIK